MLGVAQLWGLTARDWVALRPVLAVFSFVMGASIASFLNVVIWRCPRGESLWWPPSHCPKCNHRIRWWQNLPIVAYLALRGRCAHCHAPISPRYLGVETLGGVLFLAAFWQYGLIAPILWVWISLMIVGSFIDFDHQLLPDFVTVGGMVLGLVLALAEGLTGLPLALTAAPAVAEGAWYAPLLAPGTWYSPVVWSLVGLSFGFGMMWLIRWVGSVACRREAMGMGDVFLMGAIGALFGPVATVFTLMASSVVGSVVGLIMCALAKAKLGRFTPIPFGPYLCLGCLVWMFYGPELVRWYVALLGFK